jgi:hypothetical protein
MMDMRRRDFMAATAAGLGMLVLPDWGFADAEASGADPTAHLKLDWTGQIKWGNVVDITKFQGEDWHQKLAAAQDAVVKIGGGVVYFPAGTLC